MSAVVIVDSGCANVASISFAFERLGVQTATSSDRSEIRAASHVVLPGVGSAPTFMARVRDRDLYQCLRDLKAPCLGICLGMQAMFFESEEGPTRMLAIFDERVHRLERTAGLSIPHMGWNQLEAVLPSSPLLDGVADGAYAYFVHSYFVPRSEISVATTNHGAEISAIVSRDNFHGCQFHPERSGSVGARVLKNFLRLS